MVWPAIIAGAAAIGSGLLSNSSAKSREKAADYREYELSKKLWQYQMSNSHQFQVDDLRKAGLNPMLSASAQSNTTGNVGGHISSGGNFENVLTNAVQAYQAHQQAKVQNSQVIANNATAENQTASAAEHAQNARYQKMKNDHLEKDEEARKAEFGHQDVQHPTQLGRDVIEEGYNFGINAGKTLRHWYNKASPYVADKYEQFKKWVKEDSPIASAKQAYENYNAFWKRVEDRRRAMKYRYVKRK